LSGAVVLEGTEDDLYEPADPRPLPSALYMVATGLWDENDVSTRTDDVTDDEVSACL
jgi:hypothetical protein